MDPLRIEISKFRSQLRLNNPNQVPVPVVNPSGLWRFDWKDLRLAIPRRALVVAPRRSL